MLDARLQSGRLASCSARLATRAVRRLPQPLRTPNGRTAARALAAGDGELAADSAPSTYARAAQWPPGRSAELVTSQAVRSPPPAASEVLLQLSAWNLLIALLAASATAVCTSITVFLLAMWPMLKACCCSAAALRAHARARPPSARRWPPRRLCGRWRRRLLRRARLRRRWRS